MKISRTPLDGLLIIEPVMFQDERGFFLETFQSSRYKRAGIKEDFIQDNQSRSAKGVLRGLHFQVKRPHAQIVTLLSGHIFDVGVDIRPTSRTFGKWFGIELSESGPRQIYLAPGFAHGFCVLSDWADLHYKVSGEYDPADEGGVIWNDPEINISWPIAERLISARDMRFPKLSDISFR